MDKARRIAKMTGKGLSTVRNILRGDANRYGAEARRVVLLAAKELQAQAQRAALRRQETLRRKRVVVVVLCRCGEETRVSVPAVRVCDRCGSTSEAFNWCASCGQLMCKGCTAGWETRPDLGRLHALVCCDCAKGGETKCPPAADTCGRAKAKEEFRTNRTDSQRAL